MIISAMTITEERKEEVTFSEPYFEATQYVVVREDSEISTLDDLIGKTVGVQINTTGVCHHRFLCKQGKLRQLVAGANILYRFVSQWVVPGIYPLALKGDNAIPV